MPGYEVVTPRPVRKPIDALAGKRAGYQRVHAQLSHDPCAPELGAYRLAGPLEPVVCGAHLDRGYRLAFTMQPPEAAGQPTRVVILYVGQREPHHHRQRDIWTILHDLFGVESPPTDHDRPSCCKGSVPEIKQGDLDEFLRDLQRMTVSEARRAAHAAAHESGRRGPKACNKPSNKVSKFSLIQPRPKTRKACKTAGT